MPYQLEIHLPDQEVESVDINETCVLGSSEQAELSIQEYDLPAKLCRFRVGQGVLTVINLSAHKPPLKIGKQKLERGKMYILDDGDVLQFGELEMIVKEVVYEEEPDPEPEPEPEPEAQVPEIPHENEEENDDIPAGLTSTDELQPRDDEDDEDDEDEESEDGVTESTSLSVTQVLKQAKEESGEHKTPKKNKVKKRERDEDHSEKTSSRLIQLSQKVKSIITKKKERTGPVKAAVPDLVSKKKSNFKNMKRTDGWPGIVPRILALFLEMGGCALLARPLALRPEFDQQWRTLLTQIDQLTIQTPLLSPLSEIMGALGSQGVLTLLLFGFLQVLINFILGRGLGYVFMGINEDSGFITKRIKALLRSLIFIITGPFLIFDLPLLFKKRSFKEWLTQSALYRPSLWPGRFSAILLFPPLILSFFVSSTFSQREIFPLEQQKIRPVQVEQKERLKSLDLLFPQFLVEERPVLPVLELEYEYENPGPGLWYFEAGTESEQEPFGIFQGPSYSLASWFKDFSKIDLILSELNPELFQLIESSSSPGPLALQQRKLIKQLLLDSLTLEAPELSDIPRLFQTYGLDLEALNRFSQNFKKSLSLNKNQELKWLSSAQADYLWRAQKNEETFRIQIIYLNSLPFKSLYFTSSIERGAKLTKLIQEELIQLQYIQPGPSPEEEKALSASYQFSDQLLRLISNQMSEEEDLEKLYQEVFEFSGEQLGGKQGLYQEYFEEQMGFLLEWLEQNKQQRPELSDFQQKIKSLLKAYQNQKTSFFIQEEESDVDKAQNKGDDMPVAPDETEVNE